jgi:D-alanine-D-alanine ligase
MGALKRRVLLLSAVEPAPRPDTDLTAVLRDLEAALRARIETDVVHVPVWSTKDIEEALAKHAPEVVFNACETLEGKSEGEPLVPLALERAGVPFTGSSAECLRLCLHKAEATTRLRHASVSVPETFVVGADVVPDDAYPLIVKPEREDGSVGIDAGSVVHDAKGLEIARGRLEGRPTIAQRYIDGREIAVTLLGWPTPEVLSPGEILYDAGVFADRARILTYASKWDEASPDYGATRSVGAELEPELLLRISECAKSAFAALGMRDYGRVDLRVDRHGTPYVIDVNPNCDLSTDGGFMRSVRRSEMSYADAIVRVIDGAIARAGAP